MVDREHIDELKRQITADNLTNRQLWDMAGDAVSEENLDLISALWELGINFIDDPYRSFSPMNHACLGHLEVVKHLVGLGVDPAGCDAEHRPYTYQAATCEYWDIVWYLLENGADVNALDLCDGFSLLQFACRERNLDIVIRLLELGADPMRVGRCVYTYWSERHCLPDSVDFCVLDDCICALKTEHRFDAPVLFDDILKALLDRVTPDQHDAEGLTAIHLLVKRFSEEGVGYLLEKGWDINAPTEQGYSPLHVAVIDNASMISFLLQCGADPLATNEFGETPFQIANLLTTPFDERYRKQTEHITLSPVVEYPYPYPYDVTPSSELARWRDIQASDGTTMLHHAIIKNDIELLRKILQAGFNPNLAINRGYTPLQIAYQAPSHIALVDELLIAGAKPEMPGHYTYHLQRDADYFKCLLELLQKHGVDINEQDEFGRTAWHYALSTEAAEILLNNGCDPCLHGGEADPPILHHAADGDWEIVRCLIEHGTDPLSHDREGKSLLHYPKDLTEEMAQVLLDAGVDINGQDQYGMTPFMYAAIDDLATIDGWLYQHGADVTITDNTGRNVCDWASYTRSRDDYLNELSGESVDEDEE